MSMSIVYEYIRAVTRVFLCLYYTFSFLHISGFL